MESRRPLQLLALNHVSRVCADLPASYRFYTEVLGFTPVKRPSSFEFEGAWLHNYGVGLHLIKGCPPPRSKTINPKSCHISFQAASLADVEDSLSRLGVPYVKNFFVEDGVQVRQLFFHDPDDNMIEVCNCDVLPVVPLEAHMGGTGVGVGVGLEHSLPAWPAPQHHEQPVVPGARYTAPSGSDAGSDAGSDDSSHGAFEIPSSLLSGPERAAAAPVGVGEGPSDRIGEATGHHAYGSFSSAMSGVLMAERLNLGSMSITSAGQSDWASRVAVVAGSSGSSTSSGGGLDNLVVELSRRRA